MGLGDILKATATGGASLVYDNQKKKKEQANKNSADNRAREDAQKNDQVNQRINSLGLDPSMFMGDVDTVAGQVQGIDRFNKMTGMDINDLGPEVQEMLRRRKSAMNGNDPATTALRQSRGNSQRMAQARGATDAQLAQVDRNSAMDIAQKEFATKRQAEDAYQSMIGNLMGSAVSLEQGYGGLANASKDVPLPQQQSTLGTVICTEMHRQGYMSDSMLRRDRAYGLAVRINDPYVYTGYVFLATPIVSLMQKSRLFTKLISIPAMAWARDMAYDNSLLGKLINLIGQPVCRIVGKLVKEKKHA